MITALPCRQAKQSIYQMLGDLPPSKEQEDNEISFVRRSVELKITAAEATKERYDDAKAKVIQARLDKREKDTITRFVKWRNNRASEYNAEFNRSKINCKTLIGQWALATAGLYNCFCKAKTPEELQTIINELFAKKVY